MQDNSLKRFLLSGRGALTLFLFAAFIIAYWPILRQLVHIWSTSDDYSHGFFVAPVALYIVWSKKKTLGKMSVKPANTGLFLFVFSLLLYIAAYYSEIFTLASLSIVALCAGMVIYFLGFAFFRELAFPICLLLFMIPIPAQIYSSLTLPLQLFVSTVSSAITGVIGIPIFQDGNVLHISGHKLQVVSACSGLRSIISLLVLSLVFGFFMLKSNVLRTILFLSGIPVAIGVNIIRILLMIMAFEYFDFDLTKGSIHDLFGIAIYFFALISIFIIHKGISTWDTPE